MADEFNKAMDFAGNNKRNVLIAAALAFFGSGMLPKNMESFKPVVKWSGLGAGILTLLSIFSGGKGGDDEPAKSPQKGGGFDFGSITNLFKGKGAQPQGQYTGSYNLLAGRSGQRATAATAGVEVTIGGGGNPVTIDAGATSTQPTQTIAASADGINAILGAATGADATKLTTVKADPRLIFAKAFVMQSSTDNAIGKLRQDNVKFSIRSTPPSEWDNIKAPDMEPVLKCLGLDAANLSTTKNDPNFLNKWAKLPEQFKRNPLVVLTGFKTNDAFAESVAWAVKDLTGGTITEEQAKELIAAGIAYEQAKSTPAPAALPKSAIPVTGNAAATDVSPDNVQALLAAAGGPTKINAYLSDLSVVLEQEQKTFKTLQEKAEKDKICLTKNPTISKGSTDSGEMKIIEDVNVRRAERHQTIMTLTPLIVAGKNLLEVSGAEVQTLRSKIKYYNEEVLDKYGDNPIDVVDSETKQINNYLTLLQANLDQITAAKALLTGAAAQGSALGTVEITPQNIGKVQTAINIVPLALTR